MTVQTPTDPGAPRLVAVELEQTAPRWLRHAAGVSWRLLVVVAAVALVFWATSRVQLVFIAVFLALVITSVLRPMVEALNKVMPRGLATLLALLSGVTVLVGMVTYVVYSIANEWNALTVQFGDGVQRIIDWLESDAVPFTVTNEQIAEWIANLQTWLTDNAGHLAGQAANTAGSAVEVGIALSLAVFMTVFFLARGPHMWTWFLNQLPSRFRDSTRNAAGVGWYTFSGYARGTVIIASIDGVLAYILLEIIGVPLAAPLAVLVFIGAFIPLIGAPLAMVIAMIVALAALGPIQAAIVGIGIALIGQLEGHILQPLIMGKQVSLHPVIVAVSVTAGTLVAGILGAVVVVPLVSVAWAVFSKMRTLDPPMGAEVAAEEPDDPVSEPDGPSAEPPQGATDADVTS
ncbi:MAG: AI-2E family transporter [Micrococcales bacterium]|nr:AI-2E family transporter [Micrococcales bacterium]